MCNMKMIARMCYYVFTHIACCCYGSKSGSVFTMSILSRIVAELLGQRIFPVGRAKLSGI